LSLMFGGIGSLIGVIFVSQLFDYQVDLQAETGWARYWWILTAVATIPCMYFLIRYQKREVE